MKQYRIRTGLVARHGPAAAPEIARDVMPSEVALVGVDFPGLRPRFAVEVGDRVAPGQTLFADRRHGDVTYVSPVAGVVAETSFGPRRTLSVCRVRVEDAGEPDVTDRPDTAAAPRDVLLARGLWPAFRARPFGRVPAPDAVPRAIFVNAVRAGPESPDPDLVLDGQGDAFARGLEALTRLTGGTVFVAQSSSAPLGPVTDRIVHARFTGTRAAGLAGTQIDRLCPVGAGAEVWSIGYQDVIAIGHLFLTGRYMSDRVVSVTEDPSTAPRLVRTAEGVRLADLVEGDARSLACGRAGVVRAALFLGQGHDCVGPAPVHHHIARRRGDVRAIIPNRDVERALAVDLLTVPLMKALSLGDREKAAALGCLGLIEEDVFALSLRCTSGTDYAAALRAVLDILTEEAA